MYSLIIFPCEKKQKQKTTYISVTYKDKHRNMNYNVVTHHVQPMHDFSHGDDALNDACLTELWHPRSLGVPDFAVQNLLPEHLVIYRLQSQTFCSNAEFWSQESQSSRKGTVTITYNYRNNYILQYLVLYLPMSFTTSNRRIHENTVIAFNKIQSHTQRMWSVHSIHPFFLPFFLLK